MTITHHLDDSTLMTCAAGSQPEALAAVILSHLSFCPRCRAEVKTHSLIGEVLFDGLRPEPVSREAPVIALRAGEADAAPAADTSDLPAPLKAALAGDVDAIRWRRLAPGVWHAPLALSAGATGDLRLYKLAPGVTLPEHGHGGTELTLVIDGSYTDAFGTYRRGDISDLGDDTEHRPVADPEHGCICVVGTDRRMRFKGFLARLLQPFTRL